jgi:hypothetical protein
VGLGTVLLAGAGCGGSSGDAVQKAARRTLAAAGYDFSFTSTIRIGRGRPLVFAGDGSVDNASRRTRVVITGPLSGEEIVDRARATVVYLRFPAVAERIGAKKPWLRLDVTPRLWRSGFNPGAVALAQGNAAAYVEALGRPGRRPRTAGSGYSARIPVGGRSRRVTVRIADGYIRELRLVYSVPVPGTRRTIAYRTTIGYSGFGPQSPIALPPPRRVSRIGADGKPEQ